MTNNRHVTFGNLWNYEISTVLHLSSSRHAGKWTKSWFLLHSTHSSNIFRVEYMKRQFPPDQEQPSYLKTRNFFHWLLQLELELVTWQVAAMIMDKRWGCHSRQVPLQNDTIRKRINWNKFGAVSIKSDGCFNQPTLY